MRAANGSDERAGGGTAPALELRQLRAFVTLVDRGSMTAAADALGLAQSTVSECIAALERALGTAVIVRRRGARAAALTPAGTALLPHARGLIAAADAATAAVAAAAGTVPSAVRIIANESISTYVLPAALVELRARWPDVRFTVAVAPCYDVRAGVRAGDFDLGLMLGADDGGVARLATGDDVPLVVFALPSHPLARRNGRVRRAQLAPYPLYISDAAGDFHALLDRFFAEDGARTQALESTGSVEAVKRAVHAAHDALGVLPAYAVEEELHAGALVEVATDPAPPRMRLSVLGGPEDRLHPAAIELLAALGLERARR